VLVFLCISMVQELQAATSQVVIGQALHACGAHQASTEKQLKQAQVSWMFPIKASIHGKRNTGNLAAKEQTRLGFWWFVRNL
jgi:hypothetical protein